MFSRSFHITQISGIPVKVHWTFGFFFLWIVYVGNRAGMDLTGILMLCLFAMVLFGCVVLHELGHALMARKYQVGTKDIIISPIGGVARLMNMPQQPRQELWIALAGPAVNLIIAILIGIGLLLFTDRGLLPVGDPARIFNDIRNFLPALFVLNTALILFNMVPAFPMDGGRIFRSLLSMRWGRETATKVASMLGQIIAIGFLIWGFYRGDFILSFIGIFVFFSAANEYRMVKADELLRTTQVADVFRTEFTPLHLTDPMQKAIDLLEKGQERDFLVLNEWGHIAGVLHEEFIREASRRDDTQLPVQAYLSPRYEAVGTQVNLQQLFYLFQQKGYSIIPVFNIGHLVGVVDRQALNSYISSNTGIWQNWRR